MTSMCVEVASDERRSEIEQLFNKQVAVILKLINKQLNHLQENCPEDRVVR